MVSEISSTGSIKPSAGKAASASSRSGATAALPDANSRVGGDSGNVTLTDLATRLQVLVKSVEHLPEVDQARVAQFRQALARGDYDPPSNEIAEKLEAFERELAARESEA